MASSLADRLRPRSLLAMLAILFAISSPGSARALLRIVASTPGVADIARQIGDDRVKVTTIARGSQDPHKVPVKPSFVTRLHRADALIVNGLGLEHAFIPALIGAARNARIQPGAVGYIDASIYIEPLQVPTSQNRAQGELHPLGNPHFSLDPVQGKKMARAIAEGLERVDPKGADAYREGLRRFEELLDRKISEWAIRAAPLAGVKVVSYHQDLVYLAARYGLELVGTIETKPGVPATPAHLEELIETMKREHVRLLIREVSYAPRLARRVAERTGAKIVPLAVLVGGIKGADTYVDYIGANLEALLAALPELEGAPDE